MKKMSAIFFCVVLSIQCLYPTFPVNPSCEALSAGELPREYEVYFTKAAEKLGLTRDQVHVRIPVEAAGELNPVFKTIAIIPAAHYIFVNPEWFKTLSEDARLYAAGVNLKLPLSPISHTKLKRAFFALEVAVWIGAAYASYKFLFASQNFSLNKKVIFSVIVGTLMELPFELVVDRKIVLPLMKRKEREWNRLLRNTLQVPVAAEAEYLQAYLSAIEPLVTHNPGLKPMADILKKRLDEVTHEINQQENTSA